jgi:hypothetical protein
MGDWLGRSLPAAIGGFRRARARARLERILARLMGESSELLCYEDVHATLKPTSRSSRGLQDIPLDAIVGSVGRCSDFTRTFLPLRDQYESKWARVELAATELAGLPPIEVYRIDQVYFVLDGNHRVSVARQMGATHIQAHVTEFHTRVPLSPDTKPDDLIVKSEYAGFLERTNIDRHRPEADLSVSVPGQYRKLEEHIAVHRYFMGLDFERDISFEEAVVHWYDTVYLPVVQVIREKGILRDFPERTEADLYLWIAEHQAMLEGEYGEKIGTEEAASDLARRFRGNLRTVLGRIKRRILRIFS